MFRKTLFVWIGLCICTLLAANPISGEEALKKASDFIKQKSVTRNSKMKMVYSAPGLTKASKDASYYVFNVENDRGFVIVSGDDRTVPILGYTDSGSYDPQNLPENMRAWMQGYADAIRKLDKQDIKPLNTPEKAISPVKYPIAPFVRTRWDQMEPYNRYCPELSNGGRAASGCVATAMAQVMKFYNWPQRPTGIIPGYTTGALQIKMNELPVADFDWKSMQNYYFGGETEAQKNAVAQLMLYCGVSLTMDYNESSGASTSEMGKLLINYFDYDASTRVASREDYTLQDWQELIYNELLEKRPVVCYGQSFGGGHAFVCDGYESDGFYHINWGWSGYSDGYFQLSILNPGNNSSAGASSSSDGFSYYQGAIVGIRPNQGTVYEDTPLMKAGRPKLDGDGIILRPSQDDAFEISFEQNIYNGANETYRYRMGLGVLEDNGHIIELYTPQVFEELGPNWGYFPRIWSFEMNFPDGGVYRVAPIYMEENEKVWKVAEGLDNSVLLTVKGNELTLSVSNYDLSVSGVANFGTGQAGDKQQLQATISNNGASEFYGGLFLWASQTNDKGTEAVNRIGVTVLKGETRDVLFEFTPETAGTYNLWFTTDPEGTETIGTGTVTIAAAGSDFKLSVTSTVTNAAQQSGNEYTVYGKTVRLQTVVKCEQSAFSSTVTAVLWKGGSQNAGQINLDKVIKAGEEATIDFVFENLDQNNWYNMTIYYTKGDSYVQFGSLGKVTTLPGFATWSADGTETFVKAEETLTVPAAAAAVELTGTNVTSVTPADNPNCLYFIAEGTDIPAGLEDKNVVKGDQAEKIVLTDNYDFYTPADFIATQISYNRIPTLTTNGTGGWETIVLPFKADKVMNQTDNKELKWFTSNQDNSGQFWLKEFSGTGEGDVVFFDHVQEIQANRPYIIAVPGDKWGPNWILSGKSITFSAENAEIYSGTKAMSEGKTYKFVGKTQSSTLAEAFTLNGEGTLFTKESPAIAPFRAYFAALPGYTQTSRQLSIGSGNGGGTTEIPFAKNTLSGMKLYKEGNSLIIEVAEAQTIHIYSAEGIKVRTVEAVQGRNTINGLAKGVYLIKGQKVIL